MSALSCSLLASTKATLDSLLNDLTSQMAAPARTRRAQVALQDSHRKLNKGKRERTQLAPQSSGVRKLASSNGVPCESAASVLALTMAA
eukprot:3502281-Prymnesium_polylepis.1